MPLPFPSTQGKSPRRGMRIAAVAMAAIVAVAAGFGVGLWVHGMGGPKTNFALYLTDLAAPLSKLDVHIGSVQVGDGVPLDIVNAKFDLASLHGPQGALLIAQGQVPVGVTGPIKVHFSAVHATIGSVTFNVPNPADLVLGTVGSTAMPGAALLDVDLPASITQTADGVAFNPLAAAVYTVPAAAASAASAASAAPTMPDWRNATRVDPATGAAAIAGTADSLPQATGAPVPSTQAAIHPVLGAPGDVVAGAPNGTSANVDPAEAGVHEGASVSAKTQTGYLVQFANDSKDELTMRAIVETSGGVFVQGMKSLPIAYVLANPTQAQGLAGERGVVHVEAEQFLAFNDAESKQAIRQNAVVDLVTGLKDHSGNPIDGRGIGVAVVDTGIDTLHPDLTGAINGVVVANYKVESTQVIALADTDTSGHGTHVAAIIAGQGVQDPSAKGVAPGAKLYGLGISEGSTTVWATQGFDWILQNYNSVNPPIRIVTNSWSTGTSYDPNSAITQFVNAMVAHGLVVLFSAGNNGGDGSSIQTSAQCQIPTPGVICVAGYDDMDTGTRDGKIGDYSSRGALSNPLTWPDISAPGSRVYSAKPPVGITTGADLNLYYVKLTGTSQATPHVAAVAAMMLQMQPSLSPALVEFYLKASAYKFTDGGAYTALGNHFAKGWGLVDAYAAVQRVA